MEQKCVFSYSLINDHWIPFLFNFDYGVTSDLIVAIILMNTIVIMAFIDGYYT